MSDFMQVDRVGVSRKNRHRVVDNNLLLDITNNEDCDLYFIIDEIPSQKVLNFFKGFMKVNFKDTTYKLIYALKIKPTESQLKSNVGDLYYDNRVDFKKYIPKMSKVISIGWSLYSLNYGHSELQTQAFDDIITQFEYNKIYSDIVDSYVYPTHRLNLSIFDDRFEKSHFIYQINYCLRYDYTRQDKIDINEKDKVQLIRVNNPNSFFKEFTDKECEITWDLETSGFDFINDIIKCMTISFDGKTGYYIPFTKNKDCDLVNLNLVNSFLKNKKQILANGKFDCKFLRYRGVSNARVDEDTLNLGHILNEMRSNSLKSHAFIYTKHGGYDKELDVYRKKYKIKDYSKIPEDILYKYATMDAIVTYQVYKEQHKHLKTLHNFIEYENTNYDIFWYYYNIVVPSINLHIDVEMQGLRVNRNTLLEKKKELQIKIDNHKDKIAKILGINKKDIMSSDNNISSLFGGSKSKKENNGTKKYEENIDSNEVLGIALEKKGLKDYGRTKKENYQVNNDTLRKWRKDGYEVASLILELHEFQTLMKTFIIGIEKEIKSDNKVHSTFGVLLNNSGRYYCNKPNLQQIPSRGWKADFIRCFFEPDSEDDVFVSIDFSGLQMRLATIESQDKNMINAIKKLGGDFHTITMRSAFYNNEIPLEKLLKRKSVGDKEVKMYRQISKSINFLLLFGGSASLLKRLLIDDPDDGWSEQLKRDFINNTKCNLIYYKGTKNVDSSLTVATELRRKFFEDTYPELPIYLDNQVEKSMKRGYAISPHGVIRRLPYLKTAKKDKENKHRDKLIKDDSNKYFRRIANYESIAKNSPIQSFESVILTRAILNINKRLKEKNIKARLFGTIHDAVEYQVNRKYIKVFINIAMEELTRMYSEYKDVPLEAEYNIADFYELGDFWDAGIEEIDNYLEKVNIQDLVTINKTRARVKVRRS